MTGMAGGGGSSKRFSGFGWWCKGLLAVISVAIMGLLREQIVTSRFDAPAVFLTYEVETPSEVVKTPLLSSGRGGGVREYVGEGKRLDTTSSDGSTVRNGHGSGLFVNREIFDLDYTEMVEKFKVYVYPEAFESSGEFAEVFLPHPNPYDRKIENYFSEHMFKINLLASGFLTRNPAEANLFFLPFSVNVLRNDRRVRSQAAIAEFVAQYVANVSAMYEYWNRTQGTDHFFVCCHSVGRDVVSASPLLRSNVIQAVCSSNNYHRHYVPHKDVALPQVWPRQPQVSITPPQNRTRLAFYAGRAQNSQVRQRLINAWGNDRDLDIHSSFVKGSYEKVFQTTKFCLHVKGYEVNTARIADALHYGCVPVIISDHYDLPLANVLNWNEFAVIVSHTDIPLLKFILQEISAEKYAWLHHNACQVREHFQWHASPQPLDSFHMSMYQLWLRQAASLRPLFQSYGGSS